MWHQVTQQQTSLWSVKAWEQYPWLLQGFTTRTSGNLALHTGDDINSIIANRQSISADLGIKINSWVTGNQVHGTNIEQVSHVHRGKGSTSLDTAFSNTDGLITEDANILLASFYADCVPLLFIAPDPKIIAMAHAGWRGTANLIGVRMLQTFKTLYAVESNQIEVAIGPSIGPCCYQVGEEVAKNFPDTAVKREKESIFLDLWQANQEQLINYGLPPERLHTAKVCTYCHQEFFSYRREGNQGGRMSALLLKKEDF